MLQGCDASNLIKSTPTNTAELDALPNLTLHGMDLINTAKAAVEEACPSIISCADIISLATRDAVVTISFSSITSLPNSTSGLESRYST
jgi:peroxidase